MPTLDPVLGGASGVNLRKTFKVPTGMPEHTLRITRKAGGHRAVQPERSQLFTSHALAATHERLHVAAA